MAIGQNESGRTLVRPLDEAASKGASRNPKLTALPQYEARANVIYFDFFFAFFFFAAIVCFLDAC
jgi:hypothetical protein